jgi:hypothetical protein
MGRALLKRGELPESVTLDDEAILGDVQRTEPASLKAQISKLLWIRFINGD